MDTLSRLRSGKLAGTTRLTLRCGLTEFPREIFDLADSLEILDLSGNRLSALPEDFSRLRNLRILFCSDNEFHHVPAVLGACPALEMIGFKANRIETVDDAAFPPLLRWLILTDNRLEHLPATIGRCSRLQKLMLAGNRLQSLPDAVAACTNLELIRLSANDFHGFPGWLFELPRLSWLGLGGNPCSQMPTTRSVAEIAWQELTLEAKLGEGASGVIHRAGWITEKRPVAVKIFKAGMTSDGLPAEEMAVCLAAGNHPNLIGALGIISHHPEGSAGLVMPLIDPGFVNLAGPPDFETCTRDVYPDDRRFRLSTVLRMLSALCSAARHLHAQGITHGDFYAHNVLWNAEDECLLGDFGAASSYSGMGDLERIEVRAFGCLMEELLSRGDFEESETETLAAFGELRQRCLAEIVKSRPDFDEIGRTLEDLAKIVRIDATQPDI
ncbi:MAG: leucine-rich repeat-containing protein kinase family protein [Luteolibacter sp.]